MPASALWRSKVTRSALRYSACHSSICACVGGWTDRPDDCRRKNLANGKGYWWAAVTKVSKDEDVPSWKLKVESLEAGPPRAFALVN